jgi:two-component system, cell cycle sensor histidine kinase and response regulator CckA
MKRANSDLDALSREEAIDRLRAREDELARLHAALEASKVALWDWNLVTNKVEYSTEWNRQVGCGPDEIGTSLSEWRNRVHPDDLERMMRIVPAFIANPWPDYSVEFRMRHKDGSWRWILCHADVLRDEAGGPLRMLGSQIDITDEKKAEQALAMRESQLAQFIEHCGAPMAMFDREMRYIAASRRWRKEFRVEGAVEGRRHYDLFPDLPERWIDVHARCLNGAVEKCEEDKIVHADGSVDWLRWEARPWLEAGGEIGGIVISGEVITARKAAEESLHESQLRLRAALQAGGIGTWIWDVTGDRVDVDDWTLHIAGRSREEFEGASFERMLTFVLEDDVPFVRESFRHAIEDSEEVEHEMRIPRPDGEIVWLAVKGRVERDAEGRPMRVIGALVDVTHSKRLEQELQQAQQLDAIGKLAGGVAHDFNNILTVILGQASLTAMRKDLPPAVSDSLREITVAAQRAADVASHLLAFGRRQVMQLRDVDLNELVSAAAMMLERELGRSIRLDVVRGLPRALVRVDPAMITQVVLALAENAREAMPRGGTLTIATGVERYDEASAADVTGASPGTWVCLTVADTGTGIAREVLPHVFEPFFTTKGVGKGSGLGLSTVYGIAKQHGGWVSVATEAGRGSTFQLHLPADEKLQAVEEQKPVAVRAEGRGQGVLLVEDEPAVRTLVRMTLEKFGYTVWTASGGEAALGVWEDNADEIDLLLTDVVMPGGMTGPQLVATLREKRPELKVILSSGHGADIVGDRFEWRRDAMFLQKPYDIQNLVGTVQRLLAGE